MKNFVKISIISILMLFYMSVVVNATLDCNLNMSTTKSEYSKDETVIVEVKVDNIKSDDGIIAFSATVDYDKDSLSLEKIEGEGEWSNPSYNDENGKLVTDRSNPSTDTENIIKMTFKVKDNSKPNANIYLKDAMVANGVDSPKKLNAITKTVNIKNSSKDEGSKNENKVDNSNKPTNTTNNSKNETSKDNVNKDKNENNKKDENNVNKNDTGKNDNKNQNVNKNTSKTELKNQNNKEKNKNTVQINNPSFSTSVLPHAGVVNTTIFSILLAGGIVASVIFYRKMKQVDKEKDNKK